MKKTIKTIGNGVYITIAAFLVASTAKAASVDWGNTTGFNAVGLLSGTLVPSGSLVRIGTFNITSEAIAANSTDLTFLNANFVQYSSTTIGSGNPFGDGTTPAGYWNAPTTINLTTTLGIAGTQIYYWVFDTPTLATATQTGVYTAPGNNNWVFPADAAIPNTTTTDLSDVPNSINGIVIGSYNGGQAFGLPEYNLALVPEPSSTMLLGGAALGALGWIRMRRRA